MNNSTGEYYKQNTINIQIERPPKNIVRTEYMQELNNVDNQYKYKITIDPTPQTKKPDSDEKKSIIYNNLNIITGLTIDEFDLYMKPPYSYTWSPSIMDGKRQNENWIEQSVFAIDFDKGKIEIDAVIDRLTNLNIFPQLWYETMSSTNTLRKFRVVIFLDEPIKYNHEREKISLALLKLFPEADQTCKDPSRYFLGWKI